MSLKLQTEQLVKGATGPAQVKLQLGCGANILPGWINTDAQPSTEADYLDCSMPFPFVGACLAAVFCEHLIEHVEKPQAQTMIGEVFRVLQPGGMFRVVTPCLENFAGMVLNPDGETARKYTDFIRRFTRGAQVDLSDAINSIFYLHGHRHIYRKPELNGMLTAAGFTELRSMPAGTHVHPIFAGVDGHGRAVGADINAIEAFAIEARKP